jgi:hypothetical protein
MAGTIGPICLENTSLRSAWQRKQHVPFAQSRSDVQAQADASDKKPSANKKALPPKFLAPSPRTLTSSSKTLAPWVSKTPGCAVRGNEKTTIPSNRQKKRRCCNQSTWPKIQKNLGAHQRLSKVLRPPTTHDPNSRRA